MSENDKDKEIAELRARIVKLENAANPPPRFVTDPEYSPAAASKLISQAHTDPRDSPEGRACSPPPSV